MCVTTRLTKTVVLEVKPTFPDPKKAFSKPMYMSLGGTWTSWNLFCGWLHARNYDARERSIYIPKRRKGS